MCPQRPIIKQVRELTAQGKKDGSKKAIWGVSLDYWDERKHSSFQASGHSSISVSINKQ